MTLALRVLSGPKQNTLIPLIFGLRLNTRQFDVDSPIDFSASLSLDHKKHWNISALDGAALTVGSAEKEHVTLLLGLVFHLGHVDFKVVELAPTIGPQELQSSALAWLNENFWENSSNLSIEYFTTPLRLRFTGGPLIHEEFLLSYGPRTLGFLNLDLHLKDPSWPQNLFSFFNKAGQPYVESALPQKTLVNGRPFEHHAIQNDDVLVFGQHTLKLNLITNAFG